MRFQESVVSAINRSEGRKNPRKSRKKNRPAVHIIIIGYFIGVRAFVHSSIALLLPPIFSSGAYLSIYIFLFIILCSFFYLPTAPDPLLDVKGKATRQWDSLSHNGLLVAVAVFFLFLDLR